MAPILQTEMIARAPVKKESNPPSFHCKSVQEVDPKLLNNFLVRQFGSRKGEFLTQHGSWWHKGNENRFTVMAGNGEIAAYYTTTPIRCQVNNRSYETLWWIDLVVDPAYRRQGLQRLMDDEVRGRPGLKLGIPNGPHAKILARHGWHVRDDLRKYMLPLRPYHLPSVLNSSGLHGRLLRIVSWFLEIPAAILRLWLTRYRLQNARQLTDPDPQQFAEIFAKYCPRNIVTAYRDSSFFQWRYLDAPYRQQLHFYLAGPTERPTHYLISRHYETGGAKTTRILDVFGDFEDSAVLNDLLRLAVRDAAMWGATQVTVMAAIAPLVQRLRRLGFWFSIPVHFCYHDPDSAVTTEIDNALCYWTIGDSDNDNAR